MKRSKQYNRNTSHKLEIHRETIRHLSPVELPAVEGAAEPIHSSWRCFVGKPSEDAGCQSGPQAR